MKRNLVILCAAIALVFAHANIDGAYGLYRTESAWNGSAGHFHLGLYARGFSETRDAELVGEPTGEANHGGGDINFGLGYAFTDFLAFNIAGTYHGDGVDYTDSDYNRASIGFGDTKVGLKLTMGSENLCFGLNPVLSIPTGSERSTVLEEKNYPIFGEAYGNDGGVFRYFSSGALDYGVVGLFTLKNKLMTLDLNLGYIDQNKNDDDFGWRNNYTIYRAALSWNFGKIVPFIEAGGIDYSGEDEFFTILKDSIYGPNPVFITPGISFRPGALSINLAVDIRGWEGLNERAFPTALTDSTNITTGWGVSPAWAAILGFSYCLDFQPEGPAAVLITGTTVNAKTGDPMVANVLIYKNGELVQSLQSGVDGAFSFETKDAGTYRVVASAEGFKDDDVEILLKAGDRTPLNMRLTPIPTDGELILTVIDLETKKPMTARVTVGDVIDETTSGLTRTLKAGTYTIKATVSDENYLPYERTVKIEADKKLEIEVALVKKAFKIVLPQVYFETAKAEIKPESYPVLDTAAITINKVLATGPNVTIEVQGHTDSRGSDAYNLKLSGERASAVKNYLVTNCGVEGSRLSAQGYGETKPIAPNTTAENMAKNRRVEFVILK